MTRKVNSAGDRPKFTEAELISRRQKIALEIQRKKSDAAIARLLGASRQTVRKVRFRMTEANQRGGEVDFHGKQRGSKPSLGQWSEQELRNLIKRKHPRDIFPTSKEKQWTPSLLAKLATRRWLPEVDKNEANYQSADYQVSPATMRRYMERWAEEDATESRGRDQVVLRKVRKPYVSASLIWELLCWTLDDIEAVSDLVKGIGQLPCFAREAFLAVGSAATIYRRITLLRKELMSHSEGAAHIEPQTDESLALSNPLEAALRRKLRESLLLCATDSDRDWPSIEPAGVWSVRLVPVDFASPVVEAQFGRAKAAAIDREIQEVDVSQMRILAMACDLSSGAYMIELLHAPRNMAAFVGSADLARFLGRLLPDIHERGGKLHLPISGQSIKSNAAHNKLKKQAEQLGIAVVEDMPPCFPLAYRPFVRTGDSQAVASIIYCHWSGLRPSMHYDLEGQIAFAPKRPRPRRGRPLKVRSVAD